MPPNFTDRIRNLSAQSMVHIPLSCRAAITKITADLFENMAMGDSDSTRWKKAGPSCC